MSYAGGGESRATDSDGAALSDEAVLAAADFGIFVDLASMCQKEEGASLALYWQQVKLNAGESRPAFGTELTGAPAALIKALMDGQTSFESAEMDGFGGVAGLSLSSIVCAGEGSWYQPTGRTPVETKLFKHALDQLDVIYAHKRMASFLSTRAPSGSGCGIESHPCERTAICLWPHSSQQHASRGERTGSDSP